MWWIICRKQIPYLYWSVIVSIGISNKTLVPMTLISRWEIPVDFTSVCYWHWTLPLYPESSLFKINKVAAVKLWVCDFSLSFDLWCVCRSAVHYEGTSGNIKVCFVWITSIRAADSFRGYLALTFLARECRKHFITSLTNLRTNIRRGYINQSPPVFHTVGKHKERGSSANCTDRFNVIHLSSLRFTASL